MVEVDQPGATVQVLSEEGKVEISRPGEKGPLTIAVDPGRHRLKVTKDGFQFFAKDFTMESGGKVLIHATLLPDRNSIVTPIGPAFQQWTKDVAALPAEKQVEAVINKLQELNPGFDGKETHKIEGGAVTEFKFITDNVADISPVRALQRLRNLDCHGSAPGKGKLSDLSPLRGMPLTALKCCWEPVSDLSPLKGMPLTSLDCGNTLVSDLSPLKGMPLTGLVCRDTRVSGLSPLRGMPLTSLHCGFTPVSDLSPLEGMPLTFLCCSGTPVSDLSALNGMPLAGLECDHTQVSDLSPLEGCDKLGHLDLQGTKVTAAVVAALQKALPECKIEWDGLASGPGRKPITTFNEPAFQQWMKGVAALPAEKQVEAVVKKLQDLNPGFDGKETHKIEDGVVTELEFCSDSVVDISPVRALQRLSGLDCHGSAAGKGKVSDLSPLKGMPLTSLAAHDTQVSDLSPLTGMSLTGINCSATRVSDLSPLAGMPMTRLYCGGSPVSDLSPVRGMPLDRLDCNDTPVSDLAPLKGANLTVLCFTPRNITKGIDLIRRMKSLKSVGLAWGMELPPDEFWKKYDAGEFGKPTSAAVPLDRKPITAFRDPAFQQWMKAVAALPAERQVEAVIKKLQELNPGFDGKEAHKIEGGAVTEFNFISNNVADLSPVRALRGLKSISCYGGAPGVKGKIFVLSPLRGMPLAVLKCSETRVSDLSPLKGMPLTCLWCGATSVADLSPLRGLPIASLRCDYTQVSDLSPLRGMPLTDLACDYTQVSDLSPLEGCDKLRTLTLQGTKVTAAGVAALQKALPECKIEWDDPTKAATPPKAPTTNLNEPAFQQWMRGVAALPAERQVEAVAKKLQELNPGFDGKETHKIEGGAVTELKFCSDNVADISPVRALQRLKSLECDGSSYGKSRVSDLSPLAGMPLTALGCGWTRVSDLSPLKGMPLVRLTCYCTRASDLSPLKGMPLRELHCGGTRISDLSPLRGMPLAELRCDYTQVSDLSPLRGMALAELHCDNAPVADLSPAEGMNLALITFTPKNITKGLGVIRRMKSLKTIGVGYEGKDQFPPPEFWKKYDAGEFGKPATALDDPAFQQWMKDVAALPAERQVEAVVRKLQELDPGFDGKETHKIEGGAVTELKFISDNVADISPLRALQRLKGLECHGSSLGKGKVSDLSPLKGMPLAYIDCADTAVSDLSPLKGMPLAWLRCDGTQVSGLSPLKGMPLAHLSCGGTQVSDLSPLKGMSLAFLACGSAKVSDLSPLRGMPLTEVWCDNTQVSDLSPLEGCDKLRALHLQGTKVTAAAVAAFQKALPQCKIEWPAEGQFYTPRPAAPETKP
ncbi:MAG: hypothetical protein ABSE84_07300 [Isosphaeraceae bacterium]